MCTSAERRGLDGTFTSLYAKCAPIGQQKLLGELPVHAFPSKKPLRKASCRERGDRPAMSTSDQPDYGRLRKSGDLHRRQEGSTDRCHVASRGAVSNSDDSDHASHRSNFSKKMSAEEKFRETSHLPLVAHRSVCERRPRIAWH
jgi:hypothetical protein